MVQSLGQNEAYRVKDTFEITAQHGTGHAPGLVVVLDRQIVVGNLSGTDALIRSPDGSTSHLTIDEAKDHLAATSLFFKGRTIKDVPVDSQVEIAYQ